MKSKRQEKILELIEKYNIETQEELIARLAECGIESKQTTVSRDIKELYLYKEPIGGGRSRYAVSGKADHIDNTKRLKLILNECSVGVDYAGIVGGADAQFQTLLDDAARQYLSLIHI